MWVKTMQQKRNDVWERFSKLNEQLEHAMGSTMRITLIKRAWSSYSDKSNFTKILTMDMPPNNIAAKKAIKWVAKAYGVYDTEIETYVQMYGDIGEAVYEFDGSSESTCNLSLRQIETLLNLDCSRIDGNSFNLFEESFLKMSSIEKKWFLRFWTRKSRNGFKTSTMAKALTQIYNKTKKEVDRDVQFNNLYEIVEFYQAGETPESKLIVGNFIKPMLAKAIEKHKWPKNNYCVEYKYDGNRYQIHKSGDKVIIFNRRGKDTTDQFPDVVEDILKVPINEFIIDGEIYPIKEDGSPEKHQKLGTRVHSKNKAEAVAKCPVRFVVFDILQMNGNSYIDEPLRIRLEKWHNTLKVCPFPTHRIWSDNTSEMGVMAFYHQAIQDGFEGIIIKPLNAKYQSGKRSKDWIKYKPPLIELDVVIVGARYGEGKKANVFASFDIAVKKDTGFYNIGSCGGGFSDTDLFRLTNDLRKIISSNEGNTYNVLPRVVLEVTGDIVTQNEEGNYSLRFPRCKRIRDDKPVSDINTYEEMVEQYA